MRSGNTETDILKAPERRRIRRRSAACAINRRAVCRQLANDRQGFGAFLSDGLQLSGGQAEQPQDPGCNLGRLAVIIPTLRFYTRAPDRERSERHSSMASSQMENATNGVLEPVSCVQAELSAPVTSPSSISLSTARSSGDWPCFADRITTVSCRSIA